MEHEKSLAKFSNDPAKIKDFLVSRRFDGIEFIQYDPWDQALLQKDLVLGL